MDAIGSRRGGLLGNASTRHATISQLLTCMDGLSDRGNVFVIGATNNISLIDDALKRSGRFDRAIEIPMPSVSSRLEILSYLA